MPGQAILELPYYEDSLPLLRLIAAMSLPVIFESRGGLAEPRRGSANNHRYTILCAEPIASFVVNTPLSTSSIFKTIRDLKAAHLSTEETMSEELLSLPFQGGVAGFLGYPKISDKAQLEISEGFLGLYLWAIVVDHQLAKSNLVFHPNCAEPARNRLRSLFLNGNGADSKAQATDTATNSFSLTAKFRPQTQFNSYKQAFEKIKDYISEGDCYQVNLTQKFRAQCSGSPFDAFCKLRDTSPAPFSAFIRWPGNSLISMSPERFICNRDGQLETQPIKGTRPRGVNASTDAAQAKLLSNSKKDRAENLMIVDLLRNDLGRISKIGSVKAPSLFTLETFSNVHHLVSTVTASLLDNCDSIDLLSACFPGGSITGAPKLRAMEIIEEVEESDRGPYCGSVFYWAASGDFDSNIAIRTLHWQAATTEAADTIDCWAGGGIVADSECEAEYQECFDKVQNLISALEAM